MSYWTINESVTAIDKDYFQKKLVSSEQWNKIIATILDVSVNYLQRYSNIAFVPVTSGIVKNSTSLIHSLHISADDALHIYTAKKRQCKYFICQDAPLKRKVGNTIQGMSILDVTNPSDMTRLFEDIKKYEWYTSEEWRNRSINGEVCARIPCTNPPKNQCPKCLVHYCYDHIKNHYHRVTNEELKEQHNKEESLK